MQSNFGEAGSIQPIVYINHSNRDGNGEVAVPVGVETEIIPLVPTITARQLTLAYETDVAGNFIIEKAFQGGSITTRTSVAVIAGQSVLLTVAPTPNPLDTPLETCRILFNNTALVAGTVSATLIARP